MCDVALGVLPQIASKYPSLCILTAYSQLQVFPAPHRIGIPLPRVNCGTLSPANRLTHVCPVC